MSETTLDYQAVVPSPANKTPINVYARLSVMMFLELFVWGGWYVSTGPFMNANGLGDWTATAYTLCPIAAIISPFFLGMIADRFFASERVLGVLQVIGGVAMCLAPAVANKDHAGQFIALILVHALCYMPTLGLTNTIAFHNIRNSEKEFPLIRVFGTIGWIIAGLVVSALAADKTSTQYYVTGAAAILLGLFSFALPHTPPPSKGKKASLGEILGVKAVALLKDPSFLVFTIGSFLICIPLAAYYAFAGSFVADIGVERVTAVMGIGQWMEILFMLIMPLFFARLGVKWMLAAGMGAWVLRYALFALGAPDSVTWMIIMGIALHGICYDFFFVTGFIYTDNKAGKEIRGQAQGLLVLVTQGLGLGIGAQLIGLLKGSIITAKMPEALKGDDLNNPVLKAAYDAAVIAYRKEALPQYQTFWFIPCAFALVVLIFFVLTFRDRSKPQSAAH